MTKQQIPAEKADGAHWGVLDGLDDSPCCWEATAQLTCWGCELTRRALSSLLSCKERLGSFWILLHQTCITVVLHVQISWALDSPRMQEWKSFLGFLGAVYECSQQAYHRRLWELSHFAVSEDVCPCDSHCRDYCRITPSWWSCLAFRHQIKKSLILHSCVQMEHISVQDALQK